MCGQKYLFDILGYGFSNDIKLRMKLIQDRAST